MQIVLQEQNESNTTPKQHNYDNIYYILVCFAWQCVPVRNMILY